MTPWKDCPHDHSPFRTVTRDSNLTGYPITFTEPNPNHKECQTCAAVEREVAAAVGM